MKLNFKNFKISSKSFVPFLESLRMQQCQFGWNFLKVKIVLYFEPTTLWLWLLGLNHFQPFNMLCIIFILCVTCLIKKQLQYNTIQQLVTIVTIAFYLFSSGNSEHFCDVNLVVFLLCGQQSIFVHQVHFLPHVQLGHDGFRRVRHHAGLRFAQVLLQLLNDWH